MLNREHHSKPNGAAERDFQRPPPHNLDAEQTADEAGTARQRLLTPEQPQRMRQAARPAVAIAALSAIAVGDSPVSTAAERRRALAAIDAAEVAISRRVAP
jgi:hypothetical protein